MIHKFGEVCRNDYLSSDFVKPCARILNLAFVFNVENFHYHSPY